MATRDVKMFYAESDILKIQLKTNMYIKEYGPAGAFHLAREVIQNAIDECIDENSPGRLIEIKYDEVEDRLSCEDNGRGFPEKDYPLDIFCTTIQSGSKFFREQGGGSSGEFGLGLTAVNALSESYTMTSYRQKEKTVHHISFKKGTKQEDEIHPLTKGKKHGSIVSFVPSKEYLGADTVIPYTELLDWVRKISHLVPDGITIKFTLTHGFTVKEVNTFKDNNFSDLINVICEKPMIKPCVLHAENSFEEDLLNGTKKDATLKLDVVFTYDNEDTVYDSYCNFTNTTEGGSHVDAVEETICRYFQNQVKKTMTDREKEKMDILWSDVKDGLKLLINVSTNANVQFVGNAKEKINNKKLVPIIKTMLMEKMVDYFETAPMDVLKSFIRIIKLNAKARMEMNKVKSATGKSQMSSFEEYAIKNYKPAANKGKKYRELFLIEGDSAAGSAGKGRDPWTQAILSFRGNTANAFTKRVEDMLNPQKGNEEWLRYCKVIRTGWGKDFNIDKCYFDKIIIMTDADVDGLGIASGICAFHIKVMPELVKAGKLYKSMPPLYRIANSAKEFIHTKEEFVELYQDKIMKAYKIKPDWVPKNKKFSNEEYHEFIVDTVDYQEDLIKLAKHYGLNKFLIEQIAACFSVINGTAIDRMGNAELMKWLKLQENVTTMVSFIQRRFPEIRLEDGNYLRGIAEGSYQSIAINERLISKIKFLFPIYRKYGLCIDVSEKGGDTQRMTIGEFLDVTTKYIPKILQRYKGLGEMDGSVLWKTTMDPRERVLIRLTMEDLEKELDTFNKLHRGHQEDILRRKEMVSAFEFKPADLDN